MLPTALAVHRVPVPETFTDGETMYPEDVFGATVKAGSTVILLKIASYFTILLFYPCAALLTIKTSEST